MSISRSQYKSVETVTDVDVVEGYKWWMQGLNVEKERFGRKYRIVKRLTEKRETCYYTLHHG